MSKSNRLIQLMMMVNRKKKFTVRELANEFGVSSRTILRDLQELSVMGVPLYSEVGPHGGYQVLNERILPPISFSEDETISIFFAIHALRHYVSLPFDSEFESIKKKFYLNLSGDIRESIDGMTDRVDFVAIQQPQEAPYLRQLLQASIGQEVLIITYSAKHGSPKHRTSTRSIQPIGIYANEGKWYCPSYCFLSKGYRVFRCDFIEFVEQDMNTKPIDLSDVNLKNRFTLFNKKADLLELEVELTTNGVDKFQAANWPLQQMSFPRKEDGSGTVTGFISKGDFDFFSNYFIGFGEEAIIRKPGELIEFTKKQLQKLLKKYE